jgi:lysophospholipase L1-like esterase
MKKNILLFGDSLTWGNIPKPDHFRFEKKDRIAGFLEKKLGEDFEIMEESRPGRTIATDDRSPSRNGLISFENEIASHSPLQYIFIMLGTNDLKKKFGFNDANEIPKGFIEYKKIIDDFNKDWGIGFCPKVIIVSPPKINESFLPEHYIEDFFGRQELSSDLAEAYKKFIEENKELGFDFIDASNIKVSKGDGVHFRNRAEQRNCRFIL